MDAAWYIAAVLVALGVLAALVATMPLARLAEARPPDLVVSFNFTKKAPDSGCNITAAGIVTNAGGLAEGVAVTLRAYDVYDNPLLEQLIAVGGIGPGGAQPFSHTFAVPWACTAVARLEAGLSYAR